MVLDQLWQQVAFAVLGGVGGEVLHWYMLSRKPAGSARFARRKGYWVWTVGMIGLGGLMPVLYISGSASGLLCFHLGAATPILLQKLISAAPEVVVPQGAADGASLRQFLSW
jgi:hypothetical protein